jgi:molecular chaperone DnaK
MGNIVGIDLGTTNSVAAFKLANIDVVTASDNTPPDRKLTRSVVAAVGGNMVVGEEAYRQLKINPENVINSIKRIMGRGFSDPVIQQQSQHLSYKIKQASQGTENSLVVVLDGEEYEPEDISAEILKKIVANAQTWQEKIQAQKSLIEEAVVTIPAYFNDKQRYATKNAAIRAGLKVKELLAEPTAAAISYGFSPNSDDVKTVLVYDFGGGTFDSSVITAAGNYFAELGKAGDLWLGGDDIDSKLTELVKQKVAQVEEIGNIDSLINVMPYYERIRFLGDLKLSVEKAKIDLSNQNTAKVLPATPLKDEFGMGIEIDVVITREEFEPMILPLVERSIEICRDAIRYSDYTEDMVDVILMVGGSSQIPLVQRMVKKAFGDDKVVVHPRPMYAVAEGAAIVAAGLTERSSTVSRDYCIQLINEPRYTLIKQGDTLPVSTTRVFKTEADGQSLINFKFFSPDRVSQDLDSTRNDEVIGQMWLALDKSYPKGTEVTVLAELPEKDEILSVTAVLKNNESVKVSCRFTKGGQDEQISREVEEVIEELNRDGDLTQYGAERANKLAGEVVQASNQIMGVDGRVKEDRARVAKEKLKQLKTIGSDDYNTGKFFVSRFEFVIEHCPSIITSEQRERLRQLIIDLESSMEMNNLSRLQKLIEDARQENDSLPEIVGIILICRMAIGRAYQINPTAANSMSDKLFRMIDSVNQGRGDEADRILRELAPEIGKYLDQELPGGIVATGITT